MISHPEIWDFILIAVVAIQAGILSYVADPRKKSLVLVFPFPFTIATFSLGGKIDATNVTGLINLAIFTYGVWLFHSRMKINIIVSIVFFAIFYCICGILLARILPQNEMAFWVSCLIVVIAGLMLALFTECPCENPYRTDLSPLIKIPIIVVVVTLLVMIKKFLSGFMTVFPMVGVVAAYESRFMLASVCRQIPVLMICLVSLMMTVKIFSQFFSIYFSFLFGWIVFLIVLKLTGSFLWNLGAQNG